MENGYECVVVAGMNLENLIKKIIDFLTDYAQERNVIPDDRIKSMDVIIKVPFLVVDPYCKKPVFARGVVTVPAKMETAAVTVLQEMAYGVTKKYRIVEKIKHRFAMANKG